MSDPFTGVTEDMEDAALGKAFEGQSESPEEAARVWQEILIDIQNGGALAHILLDFRDEAAKSMGDILVCHRANFPLGPEGDAMFIREINGHQEAVQRLLHTVDAIRSFKERAKAVGINRSLSDGDTEYVRQLEED